jgi:hypothetical protein
MFFGIVTFILSSAHEVFGYALPSFNSSIKLKGLVKRQIYQPGDPATSVTCGVLMERLLRLVSLAASSIFEDLKALVKSSPLKCHEFRALGMPALKSIIGAEVVITRNPSASSTNSTILERS